MDTVDAILDRLAALSKNDQQWILTRLPNSLKQQLIEADGASTFSVGAISEIGAKADELELEKLEPRLAAQVLRSEPIWVSVVMIRDAESAWRERVLICLPPMIRSAVVMSMKNTVSLSDTVVSSLRKSFMKRAGEASIEIEKRPSARTPILRWVREIWNRRRAAL